MGSMIYLALGRLEVDWGKNSGYKSHNSLFQPTDRKLVPYYYADDVMQMQEGLSKPLGDVLNRLDLLGYTERYARIEFDFLASFNTFDTNKFGFDELAAALTSIDVKSLSTDYGDGDDLGYFFRREIFDRLKLGDFVTDPHHAQHEAGFAMENISSYSLLQLLGRNPANISVEVAWQYKDVEDGGWANNDQFSATLEPRQRFLIVTEGSSDATILRHAFEVLRPSVADFFDFVDMEEGYPFTGTGNVYRFTQGLISIAVQNRIVILFDNDAEGISGFKRTRALKLPRNMIVTRLPDLDAFRNFRTIGPGGERRADINGQAASIECYLDVGDDPLVRWKSQLGDTDTYQGEIVGKRDHMLRFMKTAGQPGYDTSRIERVLDDLIARCAALSESEVTDELKADRIM